MPVMARLGIARRQLTQFNNVWEDLNVALSGAKHMFDEVREMEEQVREVEGKARGVEDQTCGLKDIARRITECFGEGEGRGELCQRAHETAQQSQEIHQVAREQRQKVEKLRHQALSLLQRAEELSAITYHRLKQLTPPLLKTSSKSNMSVFQRKGLINHIPLVHYVPAQETTSDSHFQDTTCILGRYFKRQTTVDGSWEESDLPEAYIENRHATCYICLEDFQETSARSLPASVSHSCAQPSRTENVDDGPGYQLPPEPLRQLPCTHVFHVSLIIPILRIYWRIIIVCSRNPALISGYSRNR